MTCGCSSKKKYNNVPMIENYQKYPSIEENDKNMFLHIENEKKKYMNQADGFNFLFMEPGYRQAIKCPCPYEYPSYHCPKIPFI